MIKVAVVDYLGYALENITTPYLKTTINTSSTVYHIHYLLSNIIIDYSIAKLNKLILLLLL